MKRLFLSSLRTVSLSLSVCLNLVRPVSPSSSSLPEGCSIRQQRDVVKRHFNLATLPRVWANYHFKRLPVPRSLPVGSAQYALSLSLSQPAAQQCWWGPGPPRACLFLRTKQNSRHKQRDHTSLFGMKSIMYFIQVRWKDWVVFQLDKGEWGNLLLWFLLWSCGGTHRNV